MTNAELKFAYSFVTETLNEIEVFVNITVS